MSGHTFGVSTTYRRILGALVAAAVTFAGVQSVCAQTKAKREATADEYADLAVASYKAGHYAVALAQYRKAYIAAARPLFLYNMGRCLQRIGKYGAAADHFREYLQRYRVTYGKVPDNQDRVLSLIKALTDRQNERRAKVVVGSNPPGATVTRVDTGATLGLTPLKLRLKPGIYKLRLELDNHETLDADLEVPEEEKVRAVFTLTAIREHAAVSVWVNVKRAKIELDGETVAVSPFDGRIQVKPGRHVVRVSKRGFEPYEEIIEVPRDKLLAINYVLKPQTRMFTWRSWAGWPTLAVGLAGVVGGLAASSTADDYYRDSAAFSQLSTYQNVGYGLGGVGAAAGLGLVLWEAFRNPLVRAEIVPGKVREPGKKIRPLRLGLPR